MGKPTPDTDVYNRNEKTTDMSLFSEKLKDQIAAIPRDLGAFRFDKPNAIAVDITVNPEDVTGEDLIAAIPDFPSSLPCSTFSPSLTEESDEGLWLRSGGIAVARSPGDPDALLGGLLFGAAFKRSAGKRLRIFIELEGVGVAEQYRGRGIGSLLGIITGEYLRTMCDTVIKWYAPLALDVFVSADFNSDGGENVYYNFYQNFESLGERAGASVVDDSGY